MKQFIKLPEMYGDMKARRIGKTGRVELLRVFDDGNPYWFVRVVGFDEERDRSRLKACGSEFGNGYWRFVYLDDAQSKFKELSAHPESLKEASEQEKLRLKKSERTRKLIAEGKMSLFKKTPQK